MTVENENWRVAQPTNGSTSTFTFNFEIHSEDDLAVYISTTDGITTVIGPLAKGAADGYTVDSGSVNDPGGGSITLTGIYAGYASGHNVHIIRDTDRQQFEDLANIGTRNADTTEQTWDRASLTDVELDGRINRCLALGPTHTDGSGEYLATAGNQVRIEQDPTDDDHAARKKYVDDQDAATLASATTYFDDNIIRFYTEAAADRPTPDATEEAKGCIIWTNLGGQKFYQKCIQGGGGYYWHTIFEALP